MKELFEVGALDYADGGYICKGWKTVSRYSCRADAERHVARFREVHGALKRITSIGEKYEGEQIELWNEEFYLAPDFEETPSRLVVRTVHYSEHYVPYEATEEREKPSLPLWETRIKEARKISRFYRQFVRLNAYMDKHGFTVEDKAEARTGANGHYPNLTWKCSDGVLEIGYRN